MPWRETCPMEERMRFVTACEREDLPMAALCRQFGVSRKTGYKWLARFEEEGAEGLRERSRAPHRHPGTVAPQIEEAILAVRRMHPTWGPRKVRAWLLRRDGGARWPAASTMGAIFDRAGLTVRRRLRRRVEPQSRPFAACRGPNDLWTVDLKGWFRTTDGARCEPLTMSDAASRYLLRCQAVGRPDTAHIWPLFEAAFHEFGLPRAVRSDNGPPFASVGAGGLSRLSVKLIKAGALPERIAPGKPQQNGRHERLHLTLKRDTACPPAASLRAQARRFAAFQRIYNEERPHEALGQSPPAAHYAPSPRRYTGRLRAPEYPSDRLVRRVRSNGEIKWGGAKVFIGEALIGEPVGLEELEDGFWLVRFAQVELGRLDPAGRFHRPGAGACSRPGPRPNP